MIYNITMNILLTTLNAKFIHSNLALRTLKAYCRKEYPNINIMEHTINDPLEQVVSDLVEKRAECSVFLLLYLEYQANT